MIGTKSTFYWSPLLLSPPYINNLLTSCISLNPCVSCSSYAFAICTSPIIHLVCLPKFCITLFLHGTCVCTFNFSWVLQWSLEKLKTILVQFFFFGGGGRVVQTRCIMGDICISGEWTRTVLIVAINFWLILLMPQFFFMFQIDAHMDINTPSTSLSGNIHGMPLSFLIKGVPEVWLFCYRGWQKMHYSPPYCHEVFTC